MGVTGRVASREIVCNAHVTLHVAAWGLSWFGQEVSATPGPESIGRLWFGAEKVDGYLQSDVRCEGSVSERLAGIGITAITEG